MDNDYIVKLNSAAFGLLHDLVEEEVARAREAGDGLVGAARIVAGAQAVGCEPRLRG